MRKPSKRAVVGVRSRGCLLLSVTRQLASPAGDGSPVRLHLSLVCCLTSVRHRDLRLVLEPERGN